MPPQDDDRDGLEDSGDGSFFLEGLTVSPDDVAARGEPLPPATEEFEFLSELGRGGMGVVYEVIERKSGRRVALKVISKRLELSEDAIRRFEREGRAAASISHDNCVFVYGAHIVHRSPAISMELMEGETLEDRIRREGPPDAGIAAAWVIEILEGIEASHEAGVIHRDIKPSNVFMDESGAIKVGDFGLSRSLDADQRLTMTGAFLGSPMYASPEQVRAHEQDHRTDIYSIGATFYTLLTGRPPFEASSVGDLFAQVATETPAPPSTVRPEIPRGIDRIVARAMARDPNRRYPDCASFRKAVEAYLPAASSSAGLGFRILAYMVDMTVILALSATGLILYVRFMDGQTEQNINITGEELQVAILSLSYFALLEGKWGATPGKLLFGLRVRHTNGGQPGFLRALLRVSILKIDTVVGFVPRRLVEIPFRIWTLMVVGTVPFVSMRRSNGFRGLHELASGTRVIETRKPFARRLSGSSIFDPKRRAGQRPLWTRGELEIVGVIGSTDRGTLVQARDPRLRRDVLVHEVPGRDDLLAESERSRTSARALRWLDSGEDDAGAWDVYEAPGGAALSEYREAGRGLDWTQARTILMALCDLLDEVEGVRADALWIDRKGRLRTLDFTLGDQAAAEPSTASAFAETARTVFRVDEEAPRLPEDIPEEIRELVERLVRGELPETGLLGLHQALEASAVEAHEVPRRLRFVGLVAQLLALLTFLGMFVAILDGADNSTREAWQVFGLIFGAQTVLATSAAWITRSSAVFLLLRIRVVTRFGHRASRLRCAMRSLVTWLPGVALSLLGLAAHVEFENRMVDTGIAIVLGAIYVGGAIFTVVDPERSLQDRISGTRLVH